MNWIKKLLEIKETLSIHGFDDIVDRITHAQMVLGTPGEMYLEVMNELLAIRKERPDAYSVIETEVSQLLDYGRSINYFNPKL
jgi:hypothetical protein